MILVTGASGLLGSNLIKRLLEKEEQIRAFVRPNSNLELLSPYLTKISLFKGDILDIVDINEALKDIEYVYHCAEISIFSNENRRTFFKVNVEGTANLVNACLSFPIKKVIYISNVAAIGANPLKGEIDESLSWEKHPFNTDYGLSKQLGEREIIRGVSEGLVATILNTGFILGEGDKEGAAKWLWGKKWRNPFFYAKGKNGFVDIEDVITFSILSMEKGRNGHRYILVSENVDYQLLCNEVEESLSKKIKPLIVLKWLVRVFCFVRFTIYKTINRNGMFPTDMTKMENIKYSFVNKKALTEFGVNFMPLKATISRISAAFLKAKN